MNPVTMLYDESGLELQVPDDADILCGEDPPALKDPAGAVRAALATPVGTRSLERLVAERRPRTAAITISDITRPVPNRAFLPPLLDVLRERGVDAAQVVVIIGTGMHRPSTAAERREMLGDDICSRVEVIDHAADRPETLVRIAGDPPLSVNRRFVEADLRIVTGLIEPHFMAGFSGGRKGVCPALVDLRSVEAFHSFETLSDPLADTGTLEGNPCHEIALAAARRVGVDFLFNVAINRSRELAGIFCGDLEQAHLRGCEQVAAWTTATCEGTYDLVITCGGGAPLDRTFYQTIKGMVTALPALGARSTLLQVSGCADQLGSQAYAEMLLRWGRDWRGFIAHLSARPHETRVDQWELQMQCRVLERLGADRLWFVSDGVEPALQRTLALRPILGPGDAGRRAQEAIAAYRRKNPGARVAVIPDGPYTMLRNLERGPMTRITGAKDED